MSETSIACTWRSDGFSPRSIHSTLPAKVSDGSARDRLLAGLQPLAGGQHDGQLGEQPLGLADVRGVALSPTSGSQWASRLRAGAQHVHRSAPRGILRSDVDDLRRHLHRRHEPLVESRRLRSAVGNSPCRIR